MTTTTPNRPPRSLFPLSSPTSSTSTPIHLFDGGLGTTLESPPYEIKFTSTSTPLWSSHLLTTPSGQEILLDIHRKFLRAGSRVIGTATYQASFEGFAKTRKEEGGEEGFFRDEEEVAKLMRDGVRIVRRAIEMESASSASSRSATKGGTKPLCALSLGPLGATLIPSTEYSGLLPPELGNIDALTKWHLHRLRVFFPTGSTDTETPDIIAFETLGRIDEIYAVRNAVAEIQRHHGGNMPPFWISCVFPGEMGEKGKICDGNDVEKVVEAMVGYVSGAGFFFFGSFSFYPFLFLLSLSISINYTLKQPDKISH